MKNLLFLILLLFTYVSFSQQDQSSVEQENIRISKKQIKAVRVSEKPKMDGNLDELVWKQANIAKDFVMLRPGNGDAEPKDQKTEVRLIYDDDAIYIGATMFDPEPEKIFKQLTERDNFGTADFFGVAISPNNDGQNEFEFFVSAAGVQMDAQISPSNGEDFSWSEVWYSNVTFDDKGWYVEMKIPYSALRFSNANNQTWGINFHRRIESKREQYSWNFIDKSKGRYSQYSGELTDLTNLNPPTRLSFAPFATFIIDDYDGDTNTDFIFGLDVKYGITDNFTLFATLIPDFSQTGFDNVTLNLGPFEQRFAEQRQFFVEGADLLEKGNLFFSRRIGNRPVSYFDVEDYDEENEDIEVLKNPTEVDVLNAIKVTGRTKKGLGIAILNAVTDEGYAVIQDTITDEKTKIETEPLANYNVLVVDQEFNKNSSVSLVNTNVIRSGSFRDANVTSLVFSLANKQNSYRLSGDGSTSTVREDGINTTGFASNLRFSKTEGNIRYSLRTEFSDDNYDKNDLGFQRRNNYLNFKGNITYQIFKPTTHFNNFRIGFFGGYFRRFDPNVYSRSYVEIFGFATNKKQLSYGFEIGTNIGEGKDFFEPRTEGRYWIKNPETEIEAWISTDFRKKFAFELAAGNYWINGTDELGYFTAFSPRYRASDKLQFGYSFVYQTKFNNLGYVTTLDDDDIIFGKRDVKEVENSLSAKYSFNDRSSLSLTFRHYWSPVTYEEEYYSLNLDGNLDDSDYSGNNNINFNSWNLDLRYVWEFSRGSQITALYRNAIINFEEESQNDGDFQNNISNLFDQPLGHTFSIRFMYYLDYNKMRSWFKRKE